MKYIILVLIALLIGCGNGGDSSRKIVTFGDSITRGSAVMVGERYVDLIASNKKQYLINKGSSGMRLVDELLTTKMDEVSFTQGDTITMMVCYNDMRHGGTDQTYLNQAITRLRYFLDRFTLVKDAKVYIAGCLYMKPSSYASPVSYWANGSDQAVDMFNVEIKKIVASYGFIYVDVSKAFDATDNSNWSMDGVHPSALGHYRIADTFLKAMK